MLILYQAIIDAKIVPVLIQLSQHGETDIKKESTWAIANAASGGSPEQIWYVFVYAAPILQNLP